MGRLFWKIFVWYWLAAIALVVLGAWATNQVANLSDDGNERGHTGPRATIRTAALAQRINERLTLGDLKGARNLARNGRHTVFIVDQQGHDILARPIPEAVKHWNRTDGPTGTARWMVQAVVTPAGERFSLRTPLPERGRSRITGQHSNPSRNATDSAIGTVTNKGNSAGVARPHSPERRRLRPPRALRPLLGPARLHQYWWVRLSIALAISGLVCYLLARYLVGPVARLRGATQRMARGDLSARVGTTMGNRRDEIVDLANDFDLMAERVDTLVSSKQRLMRDVAHELRSPLARLRVALELARQRAAGRADNEHDRIELETERLSYLISEILTLEQLAEPMQPAATEQLDIGRLVEEVCEDASFESQGLTTATAHDGLSTPKVNCHVSGTPNVRGQAMQLRSAIENIVRNACKYAEDGSVVTVSVALSDDKAAVEIIVEDEGPGVPNEALEHIFEPFYRVDDARARSHGGHGLGLAIAARIAQRHKGTVRAHNQEGTHGLRVTFALPLS
ncbi:MAG: signal transduction histidine kinase [Gammaproteobacteria bacterium]|jgi:signal transduction histidine kinase